jgi:hypothetical protein
MVKIKDNALEEKSFGRSGRKKMDQHQNRGMALTAAAVFLLALLKENTSTVFILTSLVILGSGIYRKGGNFTGVLSPSPKEC